MIGVLLLAVAVSGTVVEAERAFAALAQEKGQWTAFRATAAPDAIMFLPRASSAHAFLKDRKDPPRSVRWWPNKAWQSCDGALAVTTGGALWPDGRHGWFTTVWQKQPDGGWKWLLDHGGFTEKPRPAVPQVPVIKPAGCRKVVLGTPFIGGTPDEGYSRKEFASADGTLVVTASGYPGGHTVTVRMQGEQGAEILLADEVREGQP